MTEKIHFITYGDGRAEYFEGSIRLALQAEQTEWFDSVTNWNSKLLQSMDPKWYEEHGPQLIQGSRGHGYWIWKSKIILEMLEGMDEGDILVYLDAGCEINALGKDRFQCYVDLVNQFGFLFFYLNGDNYQICQWTKAKLLKRFDLYDGPPEILKLPQMESGVLFFKNSTATRCFVREWVNLSVEDSYSLINDESTNDEELSTFIENRHDQAILSLLFIKYEYGIAVRNENYFLLLWDKFKHPKSIPFGAFRNLSSESYIERIKLISHDLDFKYLLIREGRPIFFESSKCSSTNSKITELTRSNLLNYCYDSNGPKNLRNFFEKLALSSLEVESEVAGLRIQLLRALFFNRDHKISALERGMAAKEEIIRFQGESLQERLAILMEKQSVIDAHEVTLNQRLSYIHSLENENNDLRHRLNNLETTIHLSKLSITQKLLFQIRTRKSLWKAKFISNYGGCRRLMENQFHELLHGLRVIKHSSKYIPANLEAAISRAKCIYLDWARRVAGLELGFLKTHHPRPIRIPFSYSLKKPNLSGLPRISIITPSYQQGQYIERTIKSVISQDYQNLEYIIQDGGSRDNTLEIIKKYENYLSSYESKKDRGQSHAINQGFTKSSGEIMAWLNSDDILLPGALNYIGKFFTMNPEVDVVYGNRVIITENDFEVARWIMPEHDDEILSWADYIPQETLFWRRDIWERSGSGINENFHFAMDWDLILRFRKIGAKIVRLPRLIGGFRVHSEQKTNTNIAVIGTDEMNKLRERELGFVPDDIEIHKHLKKYIANHQYENYKWKLREIFHLL
jgi:glycosyltransferase involved in cell wall biosynthesis